MSDHEGGGPLGIDASTMLAVGGFFLVFGLIVVGLTFTLTPILMYICVPAGIVPGAIAVVWGFVEYRREKHLEEFATFLKAYRRISMDDLAKRVGMSRLDAERHLARAIDLGYVEGVVDRTTDEFVIKSAEAEQVFIERCPKCGGDVKKWAFPQERVTCPYCDYAISAPAPVAATQAPP